MPFSNRRQFLRGLDQEIRRRKNATAVAVVAVGNRSASEIRRRVPPPAWNPGYAERAPTGQLRRSIKRGPLVRRAREERVRVGLDPLAGPAARIKGSVHEKGKVIRPRRQPYMVFKGKRGEIVRAKRVRIRPKRFTERAHREMRRIGAVLFNVNFNRAVRGGGPVTRLTLRRRGIR